MWFSSIKRLILAVGLSGAVPAAAQSSPAASTSAPKHANVLIVQTRDSIQAAYHQLGQVLVAAGYDLEKANYDTEKRHGTLAYITTIDRSLPAQPAVRVALQAALLAAPVGTAIELRGTYTLDGLHLLPIANHGRPGSTAAAAWAELQRVAALFPASTLTYRRER